MRSRASSHPIQSSYPQRVRCSSIKVGLMPVSKLLAFSILLCDWGLAFLLFQILPVRFWFWFWGIEGNPGEEPGSSSFCSCEHPPSRASCLPQQCFISRQQLDPLCCILSLMETAPLCSSESQLQTPLEIWVQHTGHPLLRFQVSNQLLIGSPNLEA
jgi:hypothetical protein